MDSPLTGNADNFNIADLYSLCEFWHRLCFADIYCLHLQGEVTTEVQVTLQLTVGQSARLGVEPLSGVHDQF
jgi:hypothetical protein